LKQSHSLTCTLRTKTSLNFLRLPTRVDNTTDNALTSLSRRQPLDPFPFGVAAEQKDGQG